LDELHINKILKPLGNVAVVLSLVFVCKKFVDLNIDREILFNANSILHIVWLSLMYGFHVLIACVPWMVFLRILTGRKIPFSEAAWVLSKSNLMKYLPGNIFQFIGRNEMAIRLNLNHGDVAFATVCDFGLLVAVSLLTAALMNWQGIGKWFAQYGFPSLYSFFAAFAATGMIVVFLRVRHKGIIRKLTAKLKIFFSIRSAKAIFACFLYFTFLTLFVAALFFAVLCKILQLDVTYQTIPSILSAYMFSWVAGFIMPGAPGGIGIREATLTLLLAGIIPTEEALLAAVIFRLISTIGDFFGLLFAWVGIKISAQASQQRLHDSKGDTL
jgi:uncharacterized membrane protein YbhN (UPF0104 family)